MSSEHESTHSDEEQLNLKNQQLGQIKQAHGTCRRKTGLYGAIGGMLLALSSLGSFHYVVSQETDWSKNPNSPVYQLATENENGFRLPLAVLLGGFLGGLAMFYKARKHFARQEHFWIKENLLILEIRELRDRLYPRDARQGHHHSHPVEHDEPLEANEARSEYMGVYSPKAADTATRH